MSPKLKPSRKELKQASEPPQTNAYACQLLDLLHNSYSAHLPELQTLANAVAPALCTAVGVWLGSRNGRKLRIKAGDIEAEAQTRKQLEELLARAQEIQQKSSNTAKRKHKKKSVKKKVG